MEFQMAINNLRVLGDNFKFDLEARGKTTPDVGALMHGLAAYHMLKLEGEYDGSTSPSKSLCARSSTWHAAA